MRNKFTEWIEQGVAKFDYTPTNSDSQEDMICRMYNNIYAIPTDTHMSCLADGNRVITGHMINTPQWEKFKYSQIWKFVDFTTSGSGSLCEFLYKHNLCAQIDKLNGDVVCLVKPAEDCEACCKDICCTTESKIPQPISIISKNNNSLDVKECFTNSIIETVENLNKSVKIKGSNWYADGSTIVGVVENKTIIL